MRPKRLTENELRTYPIKGIAAGWYFRVEEISQGYYRVMGTDNRGRTISKDGIDPDELLLECKKIAEVLLTTSKDGATGGSTSEAPTSPNKLD